MTLGDVLDLSKAASRQKRKIEYKVKCIAAKIFETNWTVFFPDLSISVDVGGAVHNETRHLYVYPVHHDHAPTLYLQGTTPQYHAPPVTVDLQHSPSLHLDTGESYFLLSDYAAVSEGSVKYDVYHYMLTRFRSQK